MEEDFEVLEQNTTEVETVGNHCTYETIQPYSQFRVPLQWYVLPLRVNLAIIKKKLHSKTEDDPKGKFEHLLDNICNYFSGDENSAARDFKS